MAMSDDIDGGDVYDDIDFDINDDVYGDMWW